MSNSLWITLHWASPANMYGLLHSLLLKRSLLQIPLTAKCWWSFLCDGRNEKEAIYKLVRFMTASSMSCSWLDRRCVVHDLIVDELFMTGSSMCCSWLDRRCVVHDWINIYLRYVFNLRNTRKVDCWLT